MSQRRIFIAIQIPEELKNAAEVYLKPFFSDKNIRIPKKEGWHITLLFCGYLDDEEVEVLANVVESAASKFGFLEFALGKITFAPLPRPRMIWLSFSAQGGSASGGENSFARLKLAIEDEMVKRQKEGLFRNFRGEAREPNPHLTLARFKEGYFPNIKKFLPKDGINLTKETESFFVRSIDIMESRLSREGANYELVSRFNLKQL